MSHCSNLVVYEAHRRRGCGCRGCFPLPGRGAAPHTLPILLSLFQSIGVRQHAPNLQQICVTEGLPSEATEQSTFPILAVSRRQPAPNRLQSAKSAVSSSCLFVVLRAPSCQPRWANLPHSPSLRLSRAGRALLHLLNLLTLLRGCSALSEGLQTPLF